MLNLFFVCHSSEIIFVIVHFRGQLGGEVLIRDLRQVYHHSIVLW